MGRRIGIDLGTTNCVVAVLEMGGCRILQNREAEMLTRSVVALYKNDFLVGSPAIRRFPLAPKDTIISIKRLMGRGISDPEVEKMKKQYLYEIVEPSDGTKDSVRVKMCGKEYSPVDISAKLLKKLKSDAETVLGEEVTHAVITVPAYFNDKQRQATRQAGLKAGLTVMRIVDEPTAAAIAFGIDSAGQEARTVLVYDLGGGTFDISVLIMAAGTFAPLNLEGNMWLGGDNFDQIIVDYIVKQVRDEYGLDPTTNHRFMATLKTESQKAKETLGSARVAQIIVQGVLTDQSGNFIDVDTEITREAFEDRAKSLVDQTVSLAKKAVENAHLSIDDIDCVIMAGNASLLPVVQTELEKVFGKKKISRKIHPKNCVAMGAAITAASSGIVCPKCTNNNVTDAVECASCGLTLVGIAARTKCPACGFDNEEEAAVCARCGSPIKIAIFNPAPFNYGVQSAGDKFTLYVAKNDQFPTPEDKKNVHEFHTRMPNQRIISIPVYGGDHLDCASKNQKQGEALALLPRGCAEGTSIQVKLWLDNNGIFDLSSQLDDGTRLRSFILRGDTDQKAVEIFAECEEAYAGKESIMNEEDKRDVEKLREAVLAELSNQRFENAIRVANELKDAITKAKMPTDQMDPALIAVAFGSYIVEQYGWLLGLVAYNINLLIQAIRDAIQQGDNAGKEEKTAQLLAILNEQIEGRLLGFFLGTDAMIRTLVEPEDPALAGRLRPKLADVERKYKDVATKRGNNDPGAAMARDLADKGRQAFEKELGDVFARLQPKCPACKQALEVGKRFCACGYDFWQVVSVSTGMSE